MPAPALADEVKAGDFALSSGEALVEGADYSYDSDGRVLTILSGKEIAVGMWTAGATTADRIEVKTSDETVRARLTLAGVNIQVPDNWGTAALLVSSEGGLDLALADGTASSLKSGLYCAGLQNGENPLRITGSTGSLTAEGGNQAAGIGGGYNSGGSNITIEGGAVTATGGYQGAGIGGGLRGAGSNISVSGGTVTAKGGDWGAGIGGGDNGRGGGADAPVSVSGGRVSATAGRNAQAIGNGSGASGGSVSITGGLFADGSEAYGTVCGAKVSSGLGVFDLGSEAGVYHYSVGAAAGDFLVSGGVSGADYSYEANVLAVKSAARLTVRMRTAGAQTTAGRIVVDAGEARASLELAGVDIDVSGTDDAAALLVSSAGGLDLVLADGSASTLKSGDGCAGLQSGANPLRITGAGALIAEGGAGGAGIGGGTGEAGSGISIVDGTVTAKGGEGGAGIGGGSGGAGGAEAAPVSIEGGRIDVTAGEGARPIGNGAGAEGGSVSVTGGFFKVDELAGNEVYGVAPAEGLFVGLSGDADFPFRVAAKPGLSAERGAYGSDYVYDFAENVLVVKSGVFLAVRMSDGFATTSCRIVVDTDDAAKASLELDGVHIDASGAEGGAALLVSSSGGLDLALADGTASTLKSKSLCAGLQNGANPLRISGAGELTAVGGVSGAGIGGGLYGSGSNISIAGGTVTAKGGTYGAGIGGGMNGAGGAEGAPISIEGGRVDAEAGDGAQAIGNGASASGGPVVSVTGGFFADPNGSAGANTVYGLTPDAGFAVFEAGAHEGYPFAVDHATGDFEVSGEGLVRNVDYAYSYDTRSLAVKSGKAVTVRMRDGVDQTTTDRIVVDTDDAAVRAKLTLAGVKIDASDTSRAAALLVSSAGGLDLVLADGTKNTLKSGLDCAGLQNGEFPLTISGSTGELVAEGGRFAAGIGGGNAGDGSNISIEGGTVTAKGGDYGAGIGGGAEIAGGSGGDGSGISVSGGAVTAEGGFNGAGIGGGYRGTGGVDGAPVSISGGRIDAKAGEDGGARPIGNGDGATGDPVVSVTGGLFADADGRLPGEEADGGALPRGSVYGVEPADGFGVYDGTGVEGYPFAVGPQAALSLNSYIAYTGKELAASDVIASAKRGDADAKGEVALSYFDADGNPLGSAPADAGAYRVKASLPSGEAGGTTYARAVVQAGFEVGRGAADLGFKVSEANPTYGDTVAFSVTPTLAAGDANALTRTAPRAAVYVGDPDRGGVEVGSSAEVAQGKTADIEVDTAIRVGGERIFDAGENQVYVRVEGLANLEDATAGPLTVTVKPKELSAFAITGDASKAYDGKVATPDATGGAEAAPFNTLAVGFEGALKGDAVSVAASFTFDGTDAGTKGVTATVAGLEGDDKGCYKLPDKVAPLAYKVATGIVKASAKLNGGASLDVTNGMARTYELDLSALRPKDLAEGCSLGKVTYKLGEVKLGDYYDANNPASITPEGLLLVPVKPMATEEEGSIGFVGVTVSSTNYAFDNDGAASVAVSAVNGTTLMGSPTLEGAGSFTYGQPLSDIELTGSMEGPDGSVVTGKFRWDEPSAVLAAGSRMPGWRFEPDDATAFAPVSGASAVEVARKQVEIVGATAKGKPYDGTTAAEIDAAGEVSGALPGDDVRADASSATAAFASADAGQGIEVTFAGFKLAGEAAGNYELSAQPAPAAADIARLANEWTVPLSIEGWTAGEAPKAPTAAAKHGSVEFSYASSLEGPWSATPPTAAGSYYVRAEVQEGNWDGLSATAAFTVAAAPAPAPGPEDPPDAPGTGSGGKALAPTGGAAPTAGALAALGSAAALAALAARRRARKRG